uniref:AMP-binding protein n=1 Tax=Thauera sp. SDU_THAU2 TaxID=3136633 RepID=UPI00311F5E69
MKHSSATTLVSQLQALVPVPLAGREDDNLIEMGLDSLHVMRLVNAWRSRGARVTFAELIAQPTLRHWLALLEAAPLPVDAPPPSGVPDAQDGPDSAFALTDVQHAYWIGRQDGQVLGGVGCHAYVELDGHGVDQVRLQTAWRQVFERHAMLRTRFTDAGRQYVDEALPAPVLAVHDFSTLPAEDAEARTLALREALSHRRLRVDAGEVAGLALSRLPRGRTRLHVNVDLLVADVHSLHILLRDLAAAYAGEVPPADPAWRFSRYLAIEAERRRPQREAARRYWQDALAELPTGPRLPLAKTPAAVGRPRFVRRSHRLTAPRWQSLRAFAAANQVTAAMVLASAYAEVLARWSGDTQFLLNMPLFDRQTEHPGIEHAVADFTNLLLLRCDCRKPVSFAERARRIQRQFHRDVAHAAYSAVAVQRDLVKHGRAEGVAAPVVFACNLGTPLLSDTCKAMLGELGYMVSQTPQVWLDHQVYEDETGLLLAWDAVEGLFPDGLIDDMFRAYCGLLERLAADAAHWQQAPSLPLPAAQAAVREVVNRTNWAHTAQPLHAGLFAVAAETPSRTALIAGERNVSYGELAERALRVAALLRERGLAPGEPVAVSLPRGVDQVCAVFGVLAAGGCYVPVGMHQPPARQEKIHASAGIRWVLGDAVHLNEAVRDGTTRLDLAEAWRFAPLPGPVTVPAEARAYLIFTSGSTGAPKGVAMTHASAANTIDALNARYGVGEHCRVLAVSSLDFDLSVRPVRRAGCGRHGGGARRSAAS